MTIFNDIKFDEKGLIPVVTQDNRTDEVLMVAYMNKEALQKTLETGRVHYWSRSRNCLWLKGETSGHFQTVKSISYDCDGDTLLIKAEQKGAACHTGHHTCFYRKINVEDISCDRAVSDTGSAAEGEDVQLHAVKSSSVSESNMDVLKSKVLQEVYDVVLDRKLNPKEGSYTNYLLGKGLDKILKKVGEECSEVIIAAKNGDNNEIKYEIADLLYHMFVLMVERDIDLDGIYEELGKRR